MAFASVCCWTTTIRPDFDDILRLLDSHPRIEVRLFNPFSFRLLRPLGYITDFSRLNRRMHNKSFTVDGVVTLVGGRNIGDAYFGAGEEPLFSDLDVMAIGPVVEDVADDFRPLLVLQIGFTLTAGAGCPGR